jgi:ABC-type multidrug transport system fused ATPase/permease subunit
VLSEISFRVDEGETVALVGMTGVGKSTACQLLMRFYEPGVGCVRIGGADVGNLPMAWLREQIAMVSQDVFLFSGSILENLLIGRPEADAQEISEAIRVAGVEAFVESLPDGLETLVGERGVRLSGGQKQRIGIARALLKDAPILVLDEATSAVDTETELKIKEAVRRATEGRTVLVVAHRLSTIMAADRIVVLEDGRVVETGTYAELLSNQAQFVRLCRVREDIAL